MNKDLIDSMGIQLSLIIANFNSEYAKSREYRLIIAKSLKSNIQIIKCEDEINNSNYDELIDQVEGEYFVIIDTKHSFSTNYVNDVLNYVSKNTVYIVEPYKYFSNIPNVIPTSVPANKMYYREVSPFGVVFNTKMINNFLQSVRKVDFLGLYVNYRSYYNLSKSNYLQVGYSINTDTYNVNGFNIDHLDAELFIEPLFNSLELSLLQLRYAVLIIKGLKQQEKINITMNEFSDKVAGVNLKTTQKYVLNNDLLEFSLLTFMKTNGEKNNFHFYTTKDYDVSLYFTCEKMDSDGNVLLYDLPFLDKSLYIYKNYSAKQLQADCLDDLSEVNFYKKPITNDSVMIFMDRSTQAGDNAEYLYEYIMNNHPEFSNCYYALHPSSKDWKRLTIKGFKLLPVWSEEFYEKFYEADCVIASQAYNLNYKGKNYQNSRFVYLQHGVMLNDMKNWLIPKTMDLIVASGKPEYDYLKQFYKDEVINTGLPRFELITKDENSKNILFMPTWRFNLDKVSNNKFMESEYYQKINGVINNERLHQYLEANDINLIVKLHPNLSKRKNLFELKGNVVFADEDSSYVELISDCKLALTDYSSVVVDAAYARIPVIYYQFDLENFFDEQPYSARVDYESDGIGPVYKVESDLVEDIVEEKYLAEYENIYKERCDRFFEGIERGSICENILERIKGI